MLRPRAISVLHWRRVWSLSRNPWVVIVVRMRSVRRGAALGGSRDPATRVVADAGRRPPGGPGRRPRDRASCSRRVDPREGAAAEAGQTLPVAQAGGADAPPAPRAGAYRARRRFSPSPKMAGSPHARLGVYVAYFDAAEIYPLHLSAFRRTCSGPFNYCVMKNCTTPRRRAASTPSCRTSASRGFSPPGRPSCRFRTASRSNGWWTRPPTRSSWSATSTLSR